MPPHFRIQSARLRIRRQGAPAANGAVALLPRRSQRAPAPPPQSSNLAFTRTPVTLDTLSAHWRLALFSAQDFVTAARSAGRSLGLSDSELGIFAHQIAAERAATEQLLQAIARELGTELHVRLTTPRATAHMLGLPSEVSACLFDLDALLSGTSAIHAAAWRETFDTFLAGRLERAGERFAPFRPFDARNDYYRYLHDKPRLIGAQAFLASRGIRLSEGQPDDPVDAETVFGLGNRKNQIMQRRLEQEGVQAFTGSLQYLAAAREAGVRCAALSASANSEAMLRRAGLAPLVGCIVDGNVIQRDRLESRPAPDTIIAACELLGVEPGNAASFETTIEGLTSSGTAGVGFPVGIGSAGQAPVFRAHGAQVVVTNLGELLDPAIRN